jgi:hypothetical protein
MAIVLGDSKAIFGVPLPDLPLVLPHYVLRYKIRARSNRFAEIFLKIADGNNPLITHWERWILGADQGRLFPWMQQGINKHDVNHRHLR